MGRFLIEPPLFTGKIMSNKTTITVSEIAEGKQEAETRNNAIEAEKKAKNEAERGLNVRCRYNYGSVYRGAKLSGLSQLNNSIYHTANPRKYPV